MSEKVIGYIDHVIFRNDENGYTVMVLKTADSEEELTCVGTFPDVTQGVTIEAEGQFSQHHIYGRQFNIQSYAEKAPEDTQAMERYLGSGAIKGVGAALAARIVRCFGEDTLRIVEEEPERLAEVKGISEKKAREIAVQVTEKADMRKAMIRRIPIVWQMISRELALKLQTPLRHVLVYMQIQITGSAAV